MHIGTKSVLFGAHCFFLHPWFVAAAWWKLYGFPFDPRLWVAFFVHDLGYIGKPNMDGPEGEMHPYLGARIMNWLFDKKGCGNCSGHPHYMITQFFSRDPADFDNVGCPTCYKWFNFTLYHSRFLARKERAQFSRLCVADKLAITITPAWLYLPMVRLTGEIDEYMKDAERNSNGAIPIQESQLSWYIAVQDYVRNWVEEHKDERPDTWTPANRQAVDANGVWK